MGTELKPKNDCVRANDTTPCCHCQEILHTHKRAPNLLRGLLKAEKRGTGACASRPRSSELLVFPKAGVPASAPCTPHLQLHAHMHPHRRMQPRPHPHRRLQLHLRQHLQGRILCGTGSFTISRVPTNTGVQRALFL